MSGATVTIVYPTTSTSKFDLDYYIKTHMPLVRSTWSKEAGLVEAKITQLDPASGYIIQATLTWTSVEAFQKAAGEHGPKVMGDIPNFTDVTPLTLVGGVIWAE